MIPLPTSGQTSLVLERNIIKTRQDTVWVLKPLVRLVWVPFALSDGSVSQDSTRYHVSLEELRKPPEGLGAQAVAA